MKSRNHLNNQIEEANQQLVNMSIMIIENLSDAVQCLKNQDMELADLVIEKDKSVNAMEMEICDKGTVILATEAPVATDLRHLVGLIRIVNDLERIGDHAVHIARAVKRMGGDPYIKPIIDLPVMAEIGQSMIRDSIRAYINKDVVAAKEIALRDNRIDDYHKQIIRELLTYMMEKPSTIEQGLNLIWISRFLERLGDHVVNICEWIVYDVTGEHAEF